MDNSRVKRQSLEGLVTLVLLAALLVTMVFLASQITHTPSIVLATEADLLDDALNDAIQVCYRACTFMRGQ